MSGGRSDGIVSLRTKGHGNCFLVLHYLGNDIETPFCIQQKKKNSVAFSPQANYNDRATATCRRKLVTNFAYSGGVAW
jgi:hypothetical protein